jgi:hypothetical protein
MPTPEASPNQSSASILPSLTRREGGVTRPRPPSARWGMQEETSLARSPQVLADMTYQSAAQACPGVLAKVMDGRGQVTTHSEDPINVARDHE